MITRLRGAEASAGDGEDCAPEADGGAEAEAEADIGAGVSHDPQLPQPSPQLDFVLNNLASLF